MDKKIGKKLSLVVVAILCGSLFGEPRITLRVTDSNAYDLTQAQVKTPFIIRIAVTDDTQKLPVPKIKGLDQFRVQANSSSTNTSIINGQMTATKEHSLVVVAEQEGVYKLGPALVEVDGKTIETEVLEVVVGKKQETSQVVDEDRAFVQMSFDKEKIYFGQPVQFTLRFYYADNHIRFGGATEPNFEGFRAEKLQGPENGTRTVDGKKYRYLEWKTQLYPENVGMLTIPAVQVAFSEPGHMQSRQGLFGGMIDFFGGFREEQRRNSNILSLEVVPLPEHTPPVSAVGSFSSVTAKLNNSQAGQGEGVVLVIGIQGTGNLEQIKHPVLQLSHNLTSYESNSRITGRGKEFEYIIQGLAAGDYTIPPQEFTFFDPEQEQYQTLETQPQSLTITGVAKVNKEEQVEQESNREQKEQEITADIITSGQWRPVRQRKLSWLWFFVTMAIPLFVWIFIFLKRKRVKYLESNAPLIRYKRAFKQAHEMLDKARSGNYPGHLYHMFIELFAARLKIPRTEVSETLIEQTLRKAGMDDAELTRWRIMFAHLAESAFSSHQVTKKQDILFNQAAHWLNELGKLL